MNNTRWSSRTFVERMLFIDTQRTGSSLSSPSGAAAMPSDKAAMLPSNAVRRLRVMRASSWSRSEVAGIERHLDRALIIGDGRRLRSKIVGYYEQLPVRRRPPVAD